MPITIKDVKGNIHSECPRCHSEWFEFNYDICYHCEGCSMMASLQNEDEYFLSFEIDRWYIFWNKDFIIIGLIEDWDGSTRIYLDELHWNVSLEEINMIAAFA